MGMFCGKCRNFSWLETVARHYEMFENWPVTRSMVSFFFQEANMATVQNEQYLLDLNTLLWIYITNTGYVCT